MGGITGAAGCRGAAPAASRGSPRAAPQHPAPRSHPGPGAAHPPAGTLPWRGPAERCWATADAAWGTARLHGAGWERGCVRSLCCAVLCPECGTVCEPQGRPRAGAGTGLGGDRAGTEPGPVPGPTWSRAPLSDRHRCPVPRGRLQLRYRRGSQGSGRGLPHRTAGPTLPRAAHPQLAAPRAPPLGWARPEGAGPTHLPRGVPRC